MEKIDSSFFKKDTLWVSKNLLGNLLVHVVNGKRRSGFIIETEAYTGVEDRACHTFGGRKTERLKSMYLTYGHAYVYQIYGMHYCFNIVTRDEGDPQAVLIRALLPYEGLTQMQKARGGKSKPVASGPGMLCQALGISKTQDGLHLSQNKLFVEQTGFTFKKEEILARPRVGVDYAQEAKDWLYNFRLEPRAVERLKQSFPST